MKLQYYGSVISPNITKTRYVTGVYAKEAAIEEYKKILEATLDYEIKELFDD